jgi:sugar lactone lactonase YvrE
MAYNKNTNTLYVTDGGIMDNAELYPRIGSLFAIDLDTKVMKAIMKNNMAFPADVIYDNINDCLYVAETLENRVLRISNMPYGVLNASVYCQFNGRLGPNALALDDTGYLFVARYEYPTVMIYMI